MNRDRSDMNKLASLALLIVALAFFWTAGRQNEPMVKMRALYHLDAAEPLHNAPPVVAFTTVVLGGFRGILTDILWLRASYLQEEGKYFELLQLSDWITKLEPRCTDIWAFHAWNMAYNVSVMMSEPEDRWRWVRNGIQLLRDEGLRYNPGDPELYWEIGWMFQNKIAGRTDRAHLYYKEEWAREMNDLLGGAAPDYARLDAATAAHWIADYQLDPALMQQVDAAYGPLDWRLPDTHALYWAWRGRQCATAKMSLPCDRMIYQSVVSTFLQGRLVFRPETSTYETLPRPELLPNVLRTLDDALARHPGESVDAAYVHFLQNAIYVLNAMNQGEEARRLFDLVNAKFPGYEIPSYESLIAAPSMPSLRQAEKPPQ